MRNSYLATTTMVLAVAAMTNCGDSTSDGTGGTGGKLGGDNPFVIETSTADGKSGFVSTIPYIGKGIKQTNADGFETAGFAYTFVHKHQVITTQNLGADTIFSFTVGKDGELTQGPTLNAPPSSFANDVIWVSDDEVLISLTDAGKILDINANKMTVIKTLDLNGAAAVKGFEDTMGDVNPNPSTMVIRDGKLFVALWQTKAEFTARDGVSMAVVDLATFKVDKYISDFRGLTAAGRPGEPDSLFVDEKGDIYLYCAGGFSLNPDQHHGFLRIKSGETDFDQSYLYDMTAETVQGLTGGHSDFCNSMRYYKNGQWFCSLDDFALYSNPPDEINDFAMTVASIDLYNQKTTLIGAPFTNPTAGGALEIDSDTLYMSLATKSNGAGIFSYDLTEGTVSDGPVVTVQGYANVIRHVLPD